MQKVAEAVRSFIFAVSCGTNEMFQVMAVDRSQAQ